MSNWRHFRLTDVILVILVELLSFWSNWRPFYILCQPIETFLLQPIFTTFQLYNEDIVDLLDIEMKGKKNIRVHEDHDGNIYLTGVVSKNVNSADDCMSLLEEGAISRTTASTNMNATSSRSHAIFTLFVKHHRLVPVSF